MSLTLLFHPLSSFCQKALVGLYELDLPFTKRVIDLANEAERGSLLKVWPMGRFPVLRDEARGLTVPESSIILEYIDQLGAQRGRLVPADAERARESRLRDRFYDLYVNVPMGKIVTDKLRPQGQRDPYGVEQARAQLETAYAIADEWMRDASWAVGETFTMADCAAGTGAVLRQAGRPVRTSQAPRRVLRATRAASLVCTDARRSQTLLVHVSGLRIDDEGDRDRGQLSRPTCETLRASSRSNAGTRE